MSEDPQDGNYLNQFLRFGYPTEEHLVGLLTCRIPLDLSIHVLQQLEDDEDLRTEFFELQSEVAWELGTGAEVLAGLGVWVMARQEGPVALSRIESDLTQPDWVREWCRACNPEAASRFNPKQAPDWLSRAINQTPLGDIQILTWTDAPRTSQSSVQLHDLLPGIREAIQSNLQVFFDMGGPKLASWPPSHVEVGGVNDFVPFTKTPEVGFRISALEDFISILVELPFPGGVSPLSEAALILHFRERSSARSYFVVTWIYEAEEDRSRWGALVPFQAFLGFASLECVGAYLFARARGT